MADADPSRPRADALAVWSAAVAAVRPDRLVAAAVAAFPADWAAALTAARRVLVVGGGKAGAGMAAGLEAALPAVGDRLTGVVNVPDGATAPTRRIRLHPARPAGHNSPTAAGVAGVDDMLRLFRSAGPTDVGVCLLSGGGSALLPAPAAGLSLADKQAVTGLLAGCGAAIGEVNAVRKHLSRVKGGRLAEAFAGRLLVTLIISDVVGDRVDVIASGPTAADPSTFADAQAVVDRYGLGPRLPAAVREFLRKGARGGVPDTPKAVPSHVHNVVIGGNRTALTAAAAEAGRLGYRVVDLGAFVEGEAREVGVVLAGVVRGVRAHGTPVPPPACVLVGGEATVALGPSPGTGGRNQELVLAAAAHLGADGLAGAAVLSGGTDGEDGPTDAAGAVADAAVWRAAVALGLDPRRHLGEHNSYPFLDATGGLIRTGLTGTNVMDVRVAVVR